MTTILTIIALGLLLWENVLLMYKRNQIKKEISLTSKVLYAIIGGVEL